MPRRFLLWVGKEDREGKYAVGGKCQELGNRYCKTPSEDLHFSDAKLKKQKNMKNEQK